MEDEDVAADDDETTVEDEEEEEEEEEVGSFDNEGRGGGFMVVPVEDELFVRLVLVALRFLSSVDASSVVVVAWTGRLVRGEGPPTVKEDEEGRDTSGGGLGGRGGIFGVIPVVSVDTVSWDAVFPMVNIEIFFTGDVYCS